MAPVQRAAGSAGEMNFGVTGVAAPKAASSSTARYSSTARLDFSGAAHWSPSMPRLAVRVCPDQAAVNGEAITADQPFRHASADDRLEHAAQQVALAEAAVPALREGRMIGNLPLQPKPAEPTIGEVQVHLFARRRSDRMPRQ